MALLVYAALGGLSMTARFLALICSLVLSGYCHTQVLQSPASDYQRGRQLLWGDSDAENNSEGVAYIAASANAGYAEGQATLAQMYEIGLFVKVDQTQAARWAQAAASQQHTASMVRLAFYYLHGTGVPHDSLKAKALLESAAELGDASAMSNLGALYGIGDGVPKNNELAASWYRRAADLGNDHGKWGLAQMYVRGHGVPLDYGECYFWASQVDVAMNPQAPSLVKLCKSKLSRKERRDIDKRAKGDVTAPSN
ncbi:tetratricopeptide repeat protein [Ahniella affigens]|nr:tetratricopeptide repeat protein [Ahniella affigens]